MKITLNSNFSLINTAVLAYFHNFNGCSGSYTVAAEIICSANFKMSIIVPVLQKLASPCSDLYQATHALLLQAPLAPDLVVLALPCLALLSKPISLCPVF